MAVIYLIRHGQASLGSDNYDQLSELGIKQSQCLGNALKNRGLQFDAVYRGSMKRHAQTAEHCFASMGCESAPVNLNAGFNEYNHEEVIERYRPEFADHSNLAQFLASQPQPRKAFQLVFESALERWRQGEHDHEYSETWNQFQARCVDALNYVRHHSGDAKSIAVFSSGGPISMAIGHCLSLSDAQIAELSWSIVNCSVTALLFNSKKISLHYFNDYSHFEYNQNQNLMSYR